MFGVAKFQMFFGMPDIPYILNKGENATLQLSIFCEKVLSKKDLVSLIMFPRHPANDSSKLHQFDLFDVSVFPLVFDALFTELCYCAYTN